MTHQPFTIAALFASAASAAIHLGYIVVQHKLPVYFWNESINYSLYLSHWGTTAAAMAFAGLGAAFLAASLWCKRRVVLSWLNLATVVLLLPAIYTGCCIALMFL